MCATVRVAVLLVVALVGVQAVDERVTSGLTQLLSQGTYPPAQQSAPYPPATAQPYTQYWEQQPAQLPQGFAVQSGYEGIIAPAGGSNTWVNIYLRVKLNQ